VTGLHTRGYRPEAGERRFRNYTGRFGSRWCWEVAWNAARREDESDDEILDHIAQACLDARETQDDLVTKARARSALRGGYGVWS
jgi:hypothetical protein